MLNDEQIKQIEQMIDKKIEPVTEEIVALKAQLGKVDLLAIDNRNIRLSLGRIETSQESLETAQESLKLDFERQEKRFVRFERQTNDQFRQVNEQLVDLKADTATVKDQLGLVVTMLRRVIPPEEQR